MARPLPAPHDLRAEPRAARPLDLRYHRGRVSEVAAWMRGEAMAAPLRTPDPLMNFSGLGLAFDDAPGCADGDVLLLEFAIPGDPERWRAAGKVVRVSPVPVDEREDGSDATTRVAVLMIAHQPEGEEALRSYTLAVRRANRP